MEGSLARFRVLRDNVRQHARHRFSSRARDILPTASNRRNQNQPLMRLAGGRGGRSRCPYRAWHRGCFPRNGNPPGLRHFSAARPEGLSHATSVWCIPHLLRGIFAIGSCPVTAAVVRFDRGIASAPRRTSSSQSATGSPWGAAMTAVPHGRRISFPRCRRTRRRESRRAGIGTGRLHCRL